MKTFPICRAGAALLALFGTTAALAAPPPGRLLAAQCAQCHGTNGQPVGDMVALAGRNADDLTRRLLGMQSHLQPGQIMHRQAAGYSEAQIRVLAHYYAGLPAAGQPASSGY